MQKNITLISQAFNCSFIATPEGTLKILAVYHYPVTWLDPCKTSSALAGTNLHYCSL